MPFIGRSTLAYYIRFRCGSIWHEETSETLYDHPICLDIVCHLHSSLHLLLKLTSSSTELQQAKCGARSPNHRLADRSGGLDPLGFTHGIPHHVTTVGQILRRDWRGTAVA